MAPGMQKGQRLFVYDKDSMAFGREIVGREVFLLQGYSVDFLDKASVVADDFFLGDIAIDALPAPVLLALVMSSLMCVTWTHEKVRRFVALEGSAPDDVLRVFAECREPSASTSEVASFAPRFKMPRKRRNPSEDRFDAPKGRHS